MTNENTIDPNAETPLLVVPFAVERDFYEVIVILQDHNIARIRAYDPAEVPVSLVSPSFPGRRLKRMYVTYANSEEAARIEQLARLGRGAEALKLVTRGYRFLPDDLRATEKLGGSDMAGR
jgi:hypothetical protein